MSSTQDYRLHLLQRHKDNLESSLETVDLLKLSDELLQNDVVTEEIHERLTSLDQDNLKPEIKVRYFFQQVCQRVEENGRVFDRLVEVLLCLGGCMQGVCELLKTEFHEMDGANRRGETGQGDLINIDLPALVDPITPHSCESEENDGVVTIESLSGTKKPRLCYTTEVVHQSCDCRVAEGKSTLVEIQVSPNFYVSSYQWFKDGMPLLEGAEFSGVSSNMLYINKTCKGREGKYCCHVVTKSETICSDNIDLKVLYPSDREHLVNLYFHSEVPKDSWPPVYNFIPTSLLYLKPRHPVVLKVSKEIVEYEDFFGVYREGAVVMIEGSSGCGKTTLAHRITRDWARGRNILQGAELVFLINMNIFNCFSKHESIHDLLSVLYKDEDCRTSIVLRLKENKGKGACFILDGSYEEMNGNSVIDKLIKKKCLPLSMVVMLSSDIDFSYKRMTHITRIEISLLSKNQIYTYIDAYPFKNCSNDMVSKLKMFLVQHPNILQMCSLPFHVSMICFLFNEMEGRIPHKRTDLYEKFVIATLISHNSHHIGRYFESLSDLHGEVEIQFKSLCKLAFDMITNSQHVVSNHDGRISLCGDLVLGLLTPEHACADCNIEELYSFDHFALQEYLAAFYLAQLDKESLQNVGYDGLYNIGMLFCGIVEFERSKILMPRLFERYACEDSEYHYDFHCAFESQQKEFCDYVVKEDTLSFFQKRFNSSDFMAIGYVISKASMPTTKISFGQCLWDEDGYLGVSVFSSMADKCRLNCIKCFEILDFDDSDDMFKTLNCLLGQLPSLEELLLTYNTFGPNSIECLTRGITLPKLQSLRINLPLPPVSYPEEALKLFAFGSQNMKQVYFTSYENFCSIKYALWKKLLHYAFGFQASDISWVNLHNSSLYTFYNMQERFSCCTEVVLVNCGIGDEEAKIMACKLNNSVLENLVLDFNSISDSGVAALASFIANCSEMQEISIQCNSIGDLGATELASALFSCRFLTRLDLQGNALSDEGAVAVAKSMKKLPHIDLYLHNIGITEEGIEKVLEHRSNTKVRSMIFTSSWDGISNGGMDSLRNALNCKTLPALKLSETNINSIKILVSEIDHLKNVPALQCSVTDNDTIPVLCEIISSLDCVQHLECNEVGCISYASDQLLCETLNLCKCIRGLAFYPSRIGVYSRIHMTSMVWKNLHSLVLRGSEFDIGPANMSILFQDPMAWVHLHTLSLFRKSIDSRDIEVISKVLLNCRDLQDLDLSRNYIDDNGAIALAKGLRDHVNLRELRLGENHIHSDGLQGLVRVMKRNHLQHLDISQCVLGSEGIVDLLDVIKKDTLQTLNLCSIKLTLYDIVSLSRALKNCTQLLELHISYSNIGSQGLVYLAEGLQHCRNLQVLDISGNKITSDGIPSVLHIMEHCKYLRKLDLDNNSINMKDASVLVGKWQNKHVLTLSLGNCPEGDHRTLLQLYNSNDYVHIELLGLSRPPKLVSADK